MLTAIAFLVALCVLIVFHELGHYWVARLCGVKVLRFSLGFGKPLYMKQFTPGGTEWVVAASAGLVTRSEHGLVVLDLDGDGREETGWVMIYLHLAEEGRIPAGVLVEQGARLGHPSCEGGIATGSQWSVVARDATTGRFAGGQWLTAPLPTPVKVPAPR